MNDNTEKFLENEKNKLKTIKAPVELEERLRNALEKTTIKQQPKSLYSWKAVAAIFICIILVGYNYNGLAFYSKNFFGFDEVISSTLKELNDQGMGQSIDKSILFSDGTTLTLDGLMADANQVIIFYTIKNDHGVNDSLISSFRLYRIKGFLTNSSANSGVSQINDEKTEVKGTMTFDPVNPFAKKLTVHYSIEIGNNNWTEGEIEFSYDPNKAMSTEMKQSINKTIYVDKGTVTFQSITATPTVTVVKGILNVDNFDRVHLPLHGIELVANNVPVEITGSSSKSSVRGIKFEIYYDALPEKLDSLALVMKEFVGYTKLDQEIDLSTNELIQLEDKVLMIKNINVTSERTEITIATDDDVMLDGVSIKASEISTPLKTIVNQVFSHDDSGKTFKERTLIFESKTFPEFFYIEGMHHMKKYDSNIDIPLAVK